jgi:hypothetical protein
MAETYLKILKKHHLKHIPELLVDPEILLPRFSPGCSMCHCNGTCCAEGVLLDLKDKERILVHADLIKQYLEPQQEHDIAKWFDHSIEHDIDFPSGQCDGTATREGGCVFLDSKGLCALQKTAMAEGMDKFALKPFYCVAFPMVIDRHVLTIDDPDFTNRPQCCSIIPEGALTALDVCREEIEFILGPEGFQELEQVSKEEVVSEVVSPV